MAARALMVFRELGDVLDRSVLGIGHLGELQSCPVEVTTWPMASMSRISVDFGQECMGYDGRIRTGKIHLDHPPGPLGDGQVTMTFEDYAFLGVALSGNIRFHPVVSEEGHRTLDLVNGVHNRLVGVQPGSGFICRPSGMFRVFHQGTPEDLSDDQLWVAVSFLFDQMDAARVSQPYLLTSSSNIIGCNWSRDCLWPTGSGDFPVNLVHHFEGEFSAIWHRDHLRFNGSGCTDTAYWAQGALGPWHSFTLP
jgi:hypothetical protein